VVSGGKRIKQNGENDWPVRSYNGQVIFPGGAEESIIFFEIQTPQADPNSRNLEKARGIVIRVG